MKKKVVPVCLQFLVFITLTSFKFTDNNTYLFGKWNITAVGTADPKLVKKINKGSDSTRSDRYKKYLPELTNMMREGYQYEFLKNGEFKLTDKENKEVTSGDFTISKDGELLTLISGGYDTEYKLTKTSEKHIKLKSKKDASTMELSKK